MATGLENRLSDGRFVSGVSGNPRGRPCVPADLRDAFRANSQRALEVLVAGLDNPDAKIRVACAQHILDRGYGKPVQEASIEVTQHSSPHLAALVALATSTAARMQAPPTPLTPWSEFTNVLLGANAPEALALAASGPQRV
jgi:hypothetical protein